MEKSGSVCFPFSLKPFFSLSLLTSTCVFLIKHDPKITGGTSKHSHSVCLQLTWNQAHVHMLDTLGRVSRQTSRHNQAFTFTGRKHFYHMLDSLIRISRRVQRDWKKTWTHTLDPLALGSRDMFIPLTRCTHVSLLGTCLQDGSNEGAGQCRTGVKLSKVFFPD